MSDSHRGTWLVFHLADESYVVPVTRVDEILEYTKPTSVPRSPEYLRGVLNVRGRLIPILDLRRRLTLPVVDVTHESRIVVLDLHWDGESVLLGVVVDAVSSVVELPTDALSDPPAVGRHGDDEFLTGTARLDGEILLVVEVDRLLTPEMVQKDFRAWSSHG